MRTRWRPGSPRSRDHRRGRAGRGGRVQALPGRAAVVAGHRRVEQEVQAQVFVELLRRAGVQGLRQALDLCHEAVHVALHGREVQREALHRLPGCRGRLGPRRGRRRGWLLAAAPPGLPALGAPGPVQKAQQQKHAHPWAHGRTARARGHLRRAGGVEAARRRGRQAGGARAAARLLARPAPRVGPGQGGAGGLASRLSGPGAVGLGSWDSARGRPRAAQGLGALALARANERRGPSLGVVCGGRGGPGARALDVPPPPPLRLGGGGGGRARSFLGGGIAFSSQTASLTEGPGLPRRGRRRRSRPGSVGGSAARRPRRLIHRGQPGAAAPAPGRLEGAAGGGQRGKSGVFPRGGSSVGHAAGRPDGLGAQGERSPEPPEALRSRRPGPEQRRATGTPVGTPHPEPARSPALTAARAGGPAAPAPWRRSPSASPLYARLGCLPSGAGAEPPGTFIQRGPRDQSDGGHKAPRRGAGSRGAGASRRSGQVWREAPAPSATCRRDWAPQHGATGESPCPAPGWTDSGRPSEAVGAEGAPPLTEVGGPWGDVLVPPRVFSGFASCARDPQEPLPAPAGTRAWARMEELPAWSLFSDLRAIKCICPFYLTFPALLTGVRRRVLRIQNGVCVGESCLLRGLFRAAWTDKRKKGAFICPAHNTHKAP